MSIKKCTHIIYFLVKKPDWDSWSEKFLSQWKRKGYKALLIDKDSTKGVDNYIQRKYNEALEGYTDLQKMVN